MFKKLVITLFLLTTSLNINAEISVNTYNNFLNSCYSSAIESGADADTAETFCYCFADGIDLSFDQREFLWLDQLEQNYPGVMITHPVMEDIIVNCS